MKEGYVYILSNHSRSSLYIGMTNNIERRILQHKAGVGSCHTGKYKLKYLMYFEKCPDIKAAIAREKQLKNWHKQWNLIKVDNPSFEDLAADWYDDVDIQSVLTGRFD